MMLTLQKHMRLYTFTNGHPRLHSRGWIIAEEVAYILIQLQTILIPSFIQVNLIARVCWSHKQPIIVFFA